MSQKTVPGLVLPAEAVSTSEAQTFGGFPGVYVPGQPVAIETLGLERVEALERVEELGLPLESAQATVEVEPSGWEALTVAELDAVADANELTDYPHSGAKAKKVAYLESETALEAPEAE